VRRHVPFILAVLISGLLALVNPALWPWVAATVAVILLAGLGSPVVRALKEHHSAGRVAAIGSAGLIVVTTVSTVALLTGDGDFGGNGSVGREPAMREFFLELPVGYSTTASYMERSGEALRLDQRLTLTAEALDAGAADLLDDAREAGRRAQDEEERVLGQFSERRAAAIRNDLRTQRGLRAELKLPPAQAAFRLAVPNLAVAHRRLEATLTRELRDDGWTLDVHNNRRHVFVRTRPRRRLERATVFPAERTNALEAATPALEAELIRNPLHGALILNVSLAFDSHSAMTLERMPANAVGETFPDATRATHPSDGSQDVKFELEESARDASIEFDVRSPPFRNAILVKVVDLSLWSGINWVLMLLIAATNDWVRALPRRLLERLRARTMPPRAGRPRV
jgi:hypothetical protein